MAKVHRTVETSHDRVYSASRDVEKNVNNSVKFLGERGPGQKDYRLTRYACRLVVMASNTTSEIAALALPYFSDKVDEVEDADFAEWRQRAIASYVASGYAVDWSTRRVEGITIRNDLTHEWFVRGIKEKEFAMLTDQVNMDMHVNRDSHGFTEISRDVADAGQAAADTRKRVEELTGKPVVSPRNMFTEPDGALWQMMAADEDEEA